MVIFRFYFFHLDVYNSKPLVGSKVATGCVHALLVCLFSLIYLQAGTGQEPYWVNSAKAMYCRSLQTLV